MFTQNHFLFLFCAAALITGLLTFTKFKKVSLTRVIDLMFYGSVLCEVLKILCNMVPTGYKNGMMHDPADLPFHLCSIQIFFIFALKFIIKSDDKREKLLAFMAPTMLLGGAVALMIPTVGVSFTKTHVYQFFAFHALLVFFAIYIITSKHIRWSWKLLGRNLSYIGGIAFLATLMNSIMGSAFPKVNFMYLCRPPMDNLPILNLDHGWYAYFASLLSLVVIAMTAFHAIMILITNKKGSR